MKSRAQRRHKDWAKALRKQKISRDIYDWGSNVTATHNYYDNLHQFSKNKIHCSCEMCRFGGSWCPNQKTHSDMMKEERINQELKEYKVG